MSQDRTTDASEHRVAFSLGLEAVQPSQLYLNGRKLSLVTDGFDFGAPNYDPLPVRQIDGRWTLMDGHTRPSSLTSQGPTSTESFGTPTTYRWTTTASASSGVAWTT